eukprot:CAMPEP_0173391412 /NCGR_PEP_ID=MMETSP1356-20130122/18366_1 /TAXON_ID=77927 ORGANISM="Hemiselmis virescens, Strain PCC157" /NCGR_SAMPLE_ID=MMETSP1356 /ASSEMBLY_ACC=CAM_ASM_000847 /LENGTH=1138 /DNA_ID=CAMNT_0014349039 /DNA_START=24 /DNA_END=3436 /DNA_ORIENTATION=-
MASQRTALAGLGVVTVALLLVAFATVHPGGRAAAGGGELLQEGDRTKKLEAALHTLEGKLHRAGVKTSLTGQEEEGGVNDLLMHASSWEEPTHVPAAGNPGHEWTAEDEKAYGKEIRRALGSTGKGGGDTMGLPVGFLPIEDKGEQQVYAMGLVNALRNLKAGYWEELLGWAEGGGEGENPYISPVVEAIEAPLVKQLDAEAHKKVSKAVQEIALNKDLKPAEMKDMRARLLVPLLLRIRARVHKKVETYTVGMIRRVIKDAAEVSGDKGEGFAGKGYGILTPAAGHKHKPTVDEDMEYALRDIDTLYGKGVLSERDYDAEKAKVLSEWLGDAIKSIGGKTKARRALKDFLWPPTMTQSGCRCILPFSYSFGPLGEVPTTYEEPTDIGSPGEAWCAVDPADKDCGFKSHDPRATLNAGDYGWTHWDWTVEQPRPALPKGVLPAHFATVKTVRGCTCRLPFEVYPPALGGRIKQIYGTCTREYGQEADWCATEGDCGQEGNPSGDTDARLTWTHWDKCIGEPAGWLEPPPVPIPTVQNCTCMETWEFKPADLKLKRISYSGCSDIDDPGTAWCAVKGDDCGHLSQDPRAGHGGNRYGWTHWDKCEKEYQPVRLMANLEKHILPYPLPYVRTRHGCQCKLPFTLPTGEESYSCSRDGSYRAWCAVDGDDCGLEGQGPHVQGTDKELGWTHWDTCVGDPPGFLPPQKPMIMTQQGCVCRARYSYSHPMLAGEGMVSYEGCTDMGTPNTAWCAIDTDLSPANCGQSTPNPLAHLGAGGYGWEKWDKCVVQPVPQPEGQLPPGPKPEVQTLHGCRCKLPYEFGPTWLGGDMTLATCTRLAREGSEVLPYYWCPTEGRCGEAMEQAQVGYTHWDKCVGEPAGFLEPAPTETEMGCECLLPFMFEPKSFKRLDDALTVYTACTDTGAVAPQSAWCAVKGESCGRKSHRAKATHGPGNYGWTHWDFCKKQPEIRAVLPGPYKQPELPAVVPHVRTKSGCTCRLPFPYAPAKDCAVQPDATGCAAKGGYMMSGYCVVCKVSSWTECIREDQEGPWCATEGEGCGTRSEDVAAIDGTYGWTHWDHCIGEPAGYMELRHRKVRKGKIMFKDGSEHEEHEEQPQLAAAHHDDDGSVKVTGLVKKHEYAGG